MVDKDLLSIQETRALVRAARAAQPALVEAGQERVDALVDAIAKVGVEMAEELAKMASEETGFGKWQDKKQKNILASEKLVSYYKDTKSVGIINEDTEKKIVEIATPMGVIAGLIPSTNPTSTTLYKAIISLKSANGIVFSPHPSAVKCITATVNMIKGVLKAMDFPEDLVGVISVPTLEGTDQLMKIVDMILATGGNAMVKAAYSSGTPPSVWVPVTCLPLSSEAPMWMLRFRRSSPPRPSTTALSVPPSSPSSPKPASPTR